MKKYILVIMLLPFFSSAYATKTVEVVRHLVGNDGSGKYEIVDRQMNPVWGPDMQGVIKLQKYLVNIDCTGSGSNTCPQLLAVPNDPIYDDEDISDPALLSMQVKLDQKVDEGENGDYINEFGTIITSLNEVIHFNVTWTIDSLNNDYKMTITFNIED